jgi:hypothetical protein
MAADGTHQLRAEALLVFRQQPDDRRHTAGAVPNFGEELGLCTRAERMQVLGTALQAEPIERVEVDHGAGLSAGAVIAIAAVTG